MATILTSFPRLAEFVLSEASGQRSRENIVVTQSGAAIKSGTVLAKVAGKYVPYSNAGSGDAGIAAGILYNHLPAATGDVKAVGFVRDCEVNRLALTGCDTPGIADLATLGVLVRGVYAS